MQDPNPIPWGAQDRFQAHFIVRKDVGTAVGNHLAKTILITKGHFGAKTIVKVEWDGFGSISSNLNEDTELIVMIAKQSLNYATIYVEPSEGAVRIRSNWDNHLAFGITKELFEIYDRIAGHIKTV